MTHSLTSTISTGGKHGGGRKHWLWAPLCFTHALAMAQQRCSIPRSLDEDICRCLCCKSNETSSTHFPVNHHPIFWWTAHSSGPSSSSPQTLGSCLHLSSDTFHWFGVSTAVQVDELPILRQSTGLLWRPPFGVASGLLWKEARFFNVLSFKCHRTGQRASGQRRPTEAWVTKVKG